MNLNDDNFLLKWITEKDCPKKVPSQILFRFLNDPLLEILWKIKVGGKGLDAVRY